MWRSSIVIIAYGDKPVLPSRSTVRMFGFILCFVCLAPGALCAEQAGGALLEVTAAEAVLQADQSNQTFIKIGLRGETLWSRGVRAPVNLALVLDKSKSMAGEKIEAVRRAALDVMNLLRPDDQLSIVVYDSRVQMVLSAFHPRNGNEVAQILQSIEAGGESALFAGLSKGASEIFRSPSRRRVSRIILISDGLANIGPSDLDQLGRFGESLGRDGAVVSTIGLGLGYNEDLLALLAQRSGGNHYFAQTPAALADVLREEINTVFAVSAQNILIKVECEDGVTPIRVLGQDAEMAGKAIITSINQIYEGIEKYMIVEAVVPAAPAGTSVSVLTATAVYHNLLDDDWNKSTQTLTLCYSSSADEITSAVNASVMAEAITQLAALNSKQAVELRDQGRIQEAADLLRQNAKLLEENAGRYNSPGLKEYSFRNLQEAENLKEAQWPKNRKEMRVDQNNIQQQAAPFDAMNQAQSKD